MRVETYQNGKLIQVEEREGVVVESIEKKKTLEERIEALEAEIAQLKNVSK